MHVHSHDSSYPCCGHKPGHLACPSCGSMGKVVLRHTAARFVAPEDLASLGSGDVRFCPHPACSVAYYAPHAGVVSKDRLNVRVGLKETEGPRPLCTCYGHSYESLEAEFRAKGHVTAVMEVAEKVREGQCRCEETNPQGVCCLPEMRRVLLQLQNLPPMPEPETADACSSCSDPTGCESCS